MTQPIEGAVSGEAVEAPQSPEDRLNAAFADPENHREDEELPVEGEEAEQPVAEEAEDETEVEEEADDLPPIEAPVSWDAEAKELFASLPREAQEIVAKREGEREKFVQSKSQEATRAKQDAEQAAIQQLAQIEQSYAQGYQQLAESLAPQRPNPALLQTDPMAFYAQQANFENQTAQQRELQQQAQHLAQQAQVRAQHIEQTERAEQHRVIVESFPEYADPTTGPTLQRSLTAVAKEMGYSDELIGQARASDILAMRKAADWKAKADKYDALQASKMEKVRAAKGKPPVSAKPGTAQAPGAARNAQYASDREALRQGDGAATQRVLDSYFTKPK